MMDRYSIFFSFLPTLNTLYIFPEEALPKLLESIFIEHFPHDIAISAATSSYDPSFHYIPL